jgi:hypothetical protein
MFCFPPHAAVWWLSSTRNFGKKNAFPPIFLTEAKAKGQPNHANGVSIIQFRGNRETIILKDCERHS